MLFEFALENPMITFQDNQCSVRMTAIFRILL